MVTDLVTDKQEQDQSKLSPLANPGKADLVELLRFLKSDIHSGLDEKTVNDRLIEYGPNEIEVKAATSPLVLFIRQFQSSVVILLLVASAISFFTHDTLQGIAILAAVVINAVVGFATELKAQISLEALQKISGPTARVVRGGSQAVVPAADLVPGDVVVLEAGSRIPADLRLVEAVSLKLDESVLTGESVPVTKAPSYIDGEEESITLTYHGTHVLDGRGRGVVIKTGKSTSLGKLQCSLMEGHSAPTPLEVKLEELGKQLSVITLVTCGLIAVIGLLYKHDIWAMLEAGIALAVAAIPEGLPVVATLALAIGTQRMIKAGVLIRKLSAVETLGCTTVICSDKTGTLTENKLIVTDIFLDGRHLKVSGVGYAPEGTVTEKGEAVKADPVLTLLLKAAALCNDARLKHDSKSDTWHVTGDPTEGALLAAAGKVGLDHRELRTAHPRVSEVPFDLRTKKMTTVHSGENQTQEAYIKGSPEQVIADSKHLFTSDGPILFNENLKQKFLEVNSTFAERGLRVLGVGMKEVDLDEDTDRIDRDIVFLGLIAMKDLPRQGVDNAIDECKQAGIRVMMLTGDQPKTAASIAKDLKISSGDENALTGKELESMNVEEMAAQLEKATVLARVTPESKLNVVKALQSKGNVVAMTGDGVNDAPALQQANIGVAMGLSGTDLAREASNMVITDDNFSTIVEAIEQGRIIYDNIRRAICYLLTASVSSVITIAVAMITTGLLALTPLQMLWLNFIMHIFPGLGIVLQGAAPGMMQRPPRDPAEKLLGKFEHYQILMRSIVVALVVLGVIEYAKNFTDNMELVNTLAFATISLALLLQAWSWLFVRNPEDTTHELPPVNPFMYLMMVLSYALVAVALYLPGLQAILKTVPLNLNQLAIVFAASCLSVIFSIVLEGAWKILKKDSVRKSGELQK